MVQLASCNDCKLLASDQTRRCIQDVNTGSLVLVLDEEEQQKTDVQVEAEASTDSNPRPGFVPRQKPGLAIFGKSSNTPPSHSVGLALIARLLLVFFSIAAVVIHILSLAACIDLCIIKYGSNVLQD